MDVFHLFEYLQGDNLADVVKKVQETATFSEMIGFIQEELSRFLSHYRMNENVASVLQVISRDYQKRAVAQGYQSGSLYQSSLFRPID